jgi:hypothetical protein
MPDDLAPFTPPDPNPFERITATFNDLLNEIVDLRATVEMHTRTLARIYAKIDPGFLDDPNDPQVKSRSDLLGNQVIDRLKREAIAQALAENDIEKANLFRRYKGPAS